VVTDSFGNNIVFSIDHLVAHHSTSGIREEISSVVLTKLDLT